MGVRRKGPTLIELMGQRTSPRPSAEELRAPARQPIERQTLRPAPDSTYAHRPAPAPPEPVLAESAGKPSLLPPAGSSIRVPVGYLFLGAALVIVLGIGSYYFGFRVGAAREKAALAASQSPIPNPEDDPLNKPLANAVPDPRLQPSGAPTGKPAGPKTAGVNPSGAAKPSAPGADPRTPGLNYYVLADRISPDEAQKAADFLSSNGLAAAVVHSNNAKFRRVVASRGFAAGEVNGPDAARLKAEAARIGGLYKTQQRGPVDFAKPFAEKYQP